MEATGLTLETKQSVHRCTKICEVNGQNFGKMPRFTRVLNWPIHAIKSPIYTRTI
jgi:hypothetical protein